MASSFSLVFKVDRKEPELIAPATPTPYEIKNLSDLDNQMLARGQISAVLIYPNIVERRDDPVKVIREAVAKALVYYYPLAGRLREGANHSLMVECTGEGILFFEADAHVRLDEFGDVFRSPFPCMSDLLYDVPGSNGILDCPLLLIQVTRLICGGFIVAFRLNHTVSDASGIIQFMTAVGEIARGVDVPSIQPVWRRELISAREPPTVSCLHHFYEELPDSQGVSPLEALALVQCSFVFGPQEIEILKSHLPPHLRQCTRFEILTAFLWRCYIVCLNENPNHQVRMACAVNARSIYNPPLPVGYYGNTSGFPIAQTSAGKLCESPLGYALELVRKAKSDVTNEFMRSLVDLLVKSGQPLPALERTFVVSDVTRAGFEHIDFGWGEATYSRPLGAMILGTSFILRLRNQKGVDKMVVIINLPKNGMEKFVWEFDRTMKRPISTNTSPMSHL